MDEDAFHKLIQRACAGEDVDGIVAEVVRRCTQGTFEIRDLRLLLLGTPAGAPWNPARQAALEVVAASVTLAPSVLSIHAQLNRLPAATVKEAEFGTPPTFVAQAFIQPEGQPTCSSIQKARTRKGARQQAMTSLLARLANLPDPLTGTALDTEDWNEAERREHLSSPEAVTPTGRNPVSVLNEYAQAEHIAKPTYSVTLTEPQLFTATVRCTRQGQTHQSQGIGPSKAAARTEAAEAMLTRLRTLTRDDETIDPLAAKNEQPGNAPISADAAAPLCAAPIAIAVADELPPAGQPSTADLFAATAAVDEALRQGAAVTLLPSRHPAHTLMLLFDPGGEPLPAPAPGRLPASLQEVVRDLVLAGPIGVTPRRAAVTGWSVPLSLMLPALMATRASPEHATIAGWRAATRLGLELVAQQRIHPGLTTDGRDCWRAGPITEPLREAVAQVATLLPPEAHCLLAGTNPVRVPAPATLIWTFLDALADTMVRTPGAEAVIGSHPYVGRPASEPRQDMWEWADAIEDSVDPHPAPAVILRLKEPEVPAGQLPQVPVVLHLAPAQPSNSENSGRSMETVAAVTVWEGRSTDPALTSALLPGTRRALRRAARLFSPLEALAAEAKPNRTVLAAEDLVTLLSQTEQDLLQAGVSVIWPPSLVGALSAITVVGTPTEPAAESTARPSGHLSLENLVDCRWQITLDGQPLTEDEMTALAEAARPLIRLRDRWLLIDPTTARRARHRILAPLPSLDALSAALSGTTVIDGQPVTCEPAGTFATLVDRLRSTPDAAEPVPVPATLNATLRSYQHRALSWLSHTTSLGFGALLADDMGLGKTITTIALHLHRHESGHPGPTLVVCPASLVGNWHREFTRFAPTTPVMRYHGSGRTLAGLTGSTVVITTYGTLRRDAALLAERSFGLLVADEAQHIKNHASTTATMMRQVGGAARVAITGTPVENNLTELWAILDWTNPGLFGSRKAFRARYGEIEKNTDAEASRQLARLIRPFMMRRRKSDPGIAPELPAKVHHERAVTLTPEQTGLYEAVVRDTMDQIHQTTGIARRGLVLKLLTALRQICNTPAHFLKEEEAGTDPDHAARRSGKLHALEDLLATLHTRGEAALIFSSYAAMGHLLEAQLRARGHTTYFLTGQTSPARRQEMVDAFQNDPSTSPVFILSIKAAGTGLNLTRAEHVIHYDRPWNPAVESQATDRAHRIGQRRTVHVHNLTTEGTVEDHITALLERKRAVGEAVLLSGEGALGDLDDAELAALVSLGDVR